MSYISQDTRAFNVRINGVDVATLVTNKEATALMDARVRPSFCQIYLASKPLEGRRAAWHKAPLPKPHSMRVSAMEREKLAAKLRAEGIMRDEPYATHTEATFAAGAL